MRMKHLAGVLVVGLVVVVAWDAAGQSRDADIRAALKKIETGDARAQVAGRQELIALYTQASADDKAAVARAVANLSTPLLNKLDGMRAVHLGNAVAAIHNGAMQPALEAMVAHKNEAVRQLGWRGYVWIDPDGRVDGVRAQLIRQGSDGGGMWKTLTARVVNESSPVVLGSMVEMMRLLPLERRDLGASAGAVDAANLAALDKVWGSICQRIVDGDEEMARTARGVLMTLEYFYRSGDAEKNADQKNNVARYFVEMMYCAAKSYDLDGGEGDLAEAARQVMLDADRLIRERTGKALPSDKSLAGIFDKLKELKALERSEKFPNPDEKQDNVLSLSIYTLRELKRTGRATDPQLKRLAELEKRLDDLRRSVHAANVLDVAFDWGDVLGVSTDDLAKKYPAKIRTKVTAPTAASK